MKMTKAKTWQLAAALTVALGTTVAAILPANAVSGQWAPINGDRLSRTVEGGASAYNGYPDATVHVWNGEGNNNIYFESGYGDAVNQMTDAVVMHGAQSPNAPSIAPWEDGWIVLHRGSNNQIYFSHNVGDDARNISLGSFRQWAPIRTADTGQTLSTWDTPDVATNPASGSLTVAYRGTDGNLYTVEGQLQQDGTIRWTSNQQLRRPDGAPQYSEWGPAITTTADGRQYIFWTSRDGSGEGYRATNRYRNAPGTQWPRLNYPVPWPSNTYVTGRPSAIVNDHDRVEVAYAEAGQNYQPVPAGAEGYNLITTSVNPESNVWSLTRNTDNQGWRTSATAGFDLSNLNVTGQDRPGITFVNIEGDVHLHGGGIWQKGLDEF